jgi:hypothetical protein
MSAARSPRRPLGLRGNAFCSGDQVCSFLRCVSPGGSGASTRILDSAQSEAVALPLPPPPPGVREGATSVYALVDDTTTLHSSWHERRTNNDTSPAEAACEVVR